MLKMNLLKRSILDFQQPPEKNLCDIFGNVGENSFYTIGDTIV